MQMLAVFQYPFIQNAFLAGSLVAITTGILGYFLVVRGLTFAGHALSNIGFAGAAGAVLLGVPPVIGLLAATVGAGLAISVLGREIRERDVAIGVIMTFALGLGILFLSLYHGYADGHIPFADFPAKHRDGQCRPHSGYQQTNHRRNTHQHRTGRPGKTDTG